MTAIQLADELDVFDHGEITTEAIRDKSKTDWFAKGFAALQFSQLALSFMLRTNQGLAFSKLETITLGFAVCGVLTYLIYLNKPQNVGTPLTVTVREERLAGGHQPRYKKTYESLWAILTNRRTGADGNGKVDRIPNDNIPIWGSSSVHPAIPLLAIASGLFGAIHAIAWNSEFPTAVERILWRTATVVAAGSPIVGLVTIPLAQLAVSSGDPRAFMEDCLRFLREFFWHAPR